MKAFLIASIVVSSVQAWAFAPSLDKVTAHSEDYLPIDDFSCTLTITGYGNVPGVGRVPITLTATEATCEEAAANLRPQIIEMEVGLYN